jgi:hypothetical protein
VFAHLWVGDAIYHTSVLFGAGEVKLIFWTLRVKEKGNIYRTYNSIQTETISAYERMKISAVGEGAEWIEAL